MANLLEGPPVFRKGGHFNVRRSFNRHDQSGWPLTRPIMDSGSSHQTCIQATSTTRHLSLSRDPTPDYRFYGVDGNTA